MTDRPNGYEAIADRFIAARSDIGVDIGCGSGWPVATTLAAAGHQVAGIDPSPTLIAAFRRALPHAEAACEAVEDSRFCDRRFDAAVAIGLLFLLPETAQAALIARVGQVLRPDGHFLFSAPRIACTWHDMLTGRTSRSLGEGAYRALMMAADIHPVASITDRDGNDYGMAVAAPKRAA